MVQGRTNHSPPRTRLVLGLLVVLGLLAPVNAVAAPNGAADQGRGREPGTYSNPLQPRIPGDGVVESCADPTVIRGQEPGDTTWYMYCTTDPLNDEDLDANGDLVFHRVPTMTSRTWSTGPTSATPSRRRRRSAGWAEDDAALWAPEVVYSTTFKQYYMFFAVTDTTPPSAASGTATATTRSGSPTSDSPTGPWTFSDDAGRRPAPGRRRLQLPLDVRPGRAR